VHLHLDKSIQSSSDALSSDLLVGGESRQGLRESSRWIELRKLWGPSFKKSLNEGGVQLTFLPALPCGK
jgi:hypothetical protein